MGNNKYKISLIILNYLMIMIQTDTLKLMMNLYNN